MRDTKTKNHLDYYRKYEQVNELADNEIDTGTQPYGHKDRNEDKYQDHNVIDTLDDELNSKICGMSNPAGRIAGGSEAAPHQYPWMAAIINKTDPHEIYCGGSIISKQFILTAAHCIYNHPESAQEYKVRLGAHNLKSDNESGARDFEIEKWVMHEDFSPVLKINDIALIKLNSNVEYKHEMRPICLPPKGFKVLEGLESTVAGWGKEFFLLDGSPSLMHVDIKVVSEELCRENVLDAKAKFDNQFCAQGDNKGICSGDSGGPLMIRNEQHHFMAVGINSFGPPCGLGDFLDIYTRVSDYIDWIEKKMKNL